ncbi:MAG: flagellar basal body L-ring protein FlgH [Victivallales bacterium]|nr:flagellar basal body L-ring protein FlgH [Victivallales bacterium]
MKKISTLVAALMVSGCLYAGDPADNLRFAVNLFSVDRARDIGDLLTIVISESSTSNKKEDLVTSKTATAQQAADGGWFGTPVSGATNMFQKLSNNFKRVMNNGNLPIANYQIDATSKFTGSGSATSNDSLDMTMTVRVVDKLPNGVMVVRGDRRVVIRNESVNMVVTGLVRVRDVNANNSVESARVADAHIYYETSGEVSRGARPGYVWRIFQWLNPF